MWHAASPCQVFVFGWPLWPLSASRPTVKLCLLLQSGSYAFADSIPNNAELLVGGHFGERGAGRGGSKSDATAAFQEGYAKGGFSC